MDTKTDESRISVHEILKIFIFPFFTVFIEQPINSEGVKIHGIATRWHPEELALLVVPRITV